MVRSSLRSSGDDFCTGADWVAQRGGRRPAATHGATSGWRTPLQAHRLIELVLEVQLPVVCAVRGLGRWARLSDRARSRLHDCQRDEPLLGALRATRVQSRQWRQRGCCPGLVGVARAKELLLLGHELSGREVGRMRG